MVGDEEGLEWLVHRELREPCSCRQNGTLSQVKLLDFPQESIAVNAQHTSSYSLIPMGFLKDTPDIFTFELLHGFAQIIAILFRLFDQWGT
jgi:hypothetical protein